MVANSLAQVYVELHGVDQLNESLTPEVIYKQTYNSTSGSPDCPWPLLYYLPTHLALGRGLSMPMRTTH
jgi:hypothetical protein